MDWLLFQDLCKNPDFGFVCGDFFSPKINVILIWCKDFAHSLPGANPVKKFSFELVSNVTVTDGFTASCKKRLAKSSKKKSPTIDVVMTAYRISSDCRRFRAWEHSYRWSGLIKLASTLKLSCRNFSAGFFTWRWSYLKLDSFFSVMAVNSYC